MDEPTGPVVRECVEGYLYANPPLELLLFRRTPARGQIWVPISGKVEATDTDFESALRRELREETALAQPRRVFSLDWQVRFRADNGETWRLHAYGVEVDRSFTPVLSAEHEDAAWVSLDEAIARLHYEDNKGAVAQLVRHLAAGPSPNV
ncbi:MAG: NUDIX domain-containing protein [Thermoplasmata archaeon]